MNVEEAKKYALLCRTACPNSFKDMSEGDFKYRYMFYAKAYEEYTYEQVSNALMGVLKHKPLKGFEPDIADIVSYIESSSIDNTYLTGASAWALVRKAITCYEYKRNFDRLPKCIQEVLGDCETLNKWGLVDEDFLETNISKSFIISFDNKMKTERMTGVFDYKKYMLPKERAAALPPKQEDIVAKMICDKGYDKLDDSYAEIGKEYMRSEFRIG